ncbi:alanine racemase [Vitreoscilla massiliensis]|uniref:Alanine racemase n=1 Tax=Vitreoscilla massiliensis TaxID=1689272 RepID=A0ABY4E4S4_9NEIS|nr:alanine racemase [Vitreoscilla massiliensis]UOO90328.1 alanine racemase [Vitreoscilla massiliensis]
MRPLEAHINLANLRHNFQYLKSKHGNKTLAVIKANAYGHGSVQCAHALADLADGFAVACIEEALTLREAGVTLPIVLLEGVFENDEYALIEQHDLWPVVQNEAQLQGLLACNIQKPLTVWLKMDSGMHRAGFFPQDYADAFHRLQAAPQVAKIVKMTHFARADEPSVGMTEMQIAAFDAGCEGCEGEASMSNSAGILDFPAAHRDWGRAGLALYGLSPMPEADANLKPVMTFKTKVFGVRELAAGEVIGYGSIFKTEKPTRIGLIAVGYADGYPRLASNDSPVSIDGKPSRIIGRVSMDMTMVELNDAAQGIGSDVELWGENVSANAVAAVAGTISYEILCNVKRARFVYQD